MFEKYVQNKYLNLNVTGIFFAAAQGMNKVFLVFPNVTAQANFIVDFNISNAESNTKELTLCAYLSRGQIDAACTYYGAYLKWQQAYVVDWN